MKDFFKSRTKTVGQLLRAIKPWQLTLLVISLIAVIISVGFMAYTTIGYQSNSSKQVKQVTNKKSEQPSTKNTQNMEFATSSSKKKQSIKANRDNYNYVTHGYDYAFESQIKPGGNSKGKEHVDNGNQELNKMTTLLYQGKFEASADVIREKLSTDYFSSNSNLQLYGVFQDAQLFDALSKNPNKLSQDAMGKQLREKLKTPQGFATANLWSSYVIRNQFVMDQEQSISPASTYPYIADKFFQYVNKDQASLQPKLNVDYSPVSAIYEKYPNVKSIYQITFEAPANRKYVSNGKTKLYEYILEGAQGQLSFFGAYYDQTAGDEPLEKPLKYYYSDYATEGQRNAESAQQNGAAATDGGTFHDFYNQAR